LRGVAEGADDLETDSGVGAGNEDDSGSHCTEFTTTTHKETYMIMSFPPALVIYIYIRVSRRPIACCRYTFITPHYIRKPR
jgi:hypothetical protein